MKLILLAPRHEVRLGSRQLSVTETPYKEKQTPLSYSQTPRGVIPALSGTINALEDAKTTPGLKSRLL